MKTFPAVLLVCWLPLATADAQQSNHTNAGSLLKYVIYDFDGLNTGQTNLPDGDYHAGDDLIYSIDENPINPSPVIGDRVVRLDFTWDDGGAEFGKALMRFIELNRDEDYLNFYIYNSEGNSGNALIKLVIAEDDNANDIYEDGADDKHTCNISVPKASGWQLVKVPLKDFIDANAGGNGVLDAGFTGNGGMIFNVGLLFTRPAQHSTFDRYYVDMICFSEGPLPTGTTVLDLPMGGGSGSVLGALSNQSDPTQTPDEFEGVLPSGKKIALVNWFAFYSTSGTTANYLPGAEVQNLIDRGYTPIITWEMMHNGFSRLDPVQPNFDELISGKFDGYIDAFANQVKSYSGTVIMRIFHEFEGDWYCWGLTHNGKDPQKYIAAFRHVVNRFRAAGANNAKWMWCLNAEPKPYVRYNWVVSCYPGDEYVDMVATDIYNHPDLGTPDWKSFRYTAAESYYYLVKYFSHKPLYICEVGCRERYPGEPANSLSKGEWICQMDADLQSYFSKVSALVFFNLQKEHDWRIQSSEEAKQAFINCIWNDSYYGGTVTVTENEPTVDFRIWPNPFDHEVRILSLRKGEHQQEHSELSVFDMHGKLLINLAGNKIPESMDLGYLPSGVYLFEYRSAETVKRHKLVRL